MDELCHKQSATMNLVFGACNCSGCRAARREAGVRDLSEVPREVHGLVQAGLVASAHVGERSEHSRQLGYARYGGHVRLNGRMQAEEVVEVARRGGWEPSDGVNAIRWQPGDHGTLFFEVRD